MVEHAAPGDLTDMPAMPALMALGCTGACATGAGPLPPTTVDPAWLAQQQIASAGKVVAPGESATGTTTTCSCWPGKPALRPRTRSPAGAEHIGLRATLHERTATGWKPA